MTQASVASAAKGGGLSGGRAGRQPAEGARPGSDTAPGLGHVATQLRSVRASHKETEATRLLAQGAANVESVVVAALDALAQELGYAGAEDVLLPVLIWEPDTMMFCAVYMQDRGAEERPCVPFAQLTRLICSGAQRTIQTCVVDSRSV